jgi:hypothetical protein
MAYIGKSIGSGTFKVLDTSSNTYNGSNVTFALGTQVGSAAQLIVSHDGVIQKPGTDFILASGGASITFTTAPASGASIFIVEISGAVGGTAGTPSDNTVGVAQLNVSDGSSGQFLSTNGSGTLSFASVSSALDDITTGDAATTLATSAGNITIDAQGGDTDIIFKGTDGSSDITSLTLDGSEGGQLVLGAHGQVKFPASANVSTDANTLDDYQEGAFNLSSSQASNFLTGFYTKIGRMVWFTCAGVIPSSGNSATQTLTGLPFTVKDQTANLGGDAEGSDAQIGIVGHHSDTGAIAVKLVLANNSTNANLFQSDNSVATHATFSGDTFNLAGFYTTDQ